MLQKQRTKRSRSKSREEEEDLPSEETLDREELLRESTQTPVRNFWLLLLIPTVALSLAGSREPWVLGVVILLVGVSLVFRPPTASIPALIWIPAAGVALLALGGLLPQSWSASPSWRVALGDDYGIPVGSLRSPQPWITVEGWTLLVLGILWLVSCVGQQAGTRERRFAMQYFVLLIAGLAGLSIALFVTKREIPFWRSDWTLAFFGPFPNRNHFGGLLAIGAILGFAATYDALKRRRRVWVLFALCIIPMFVAVLLNTSRMGILLFFGGITLWMAVAASKRRTAAHAAIALSVLLALASLFMIFGSKAIERFRSQEGGVAGAFSGEGRIQIFADTARIIASSPWLGIGMGNFEPVFAMTRQSIETESRALHPESDWLWLASECGVPAALLALTVLVFLVRKAGILRKRRGEFRKSRQLRLAALLAMLILPVQSLVDTPLHTLGLATLGSVLAGLALKPGKLHALGSWPWMAAGLAVCAYGASVLLTANSAHGSLLPGNSQYRLIARSALQKDFAGDLAGSLQEWERAARLKPLQWNVYSYCAALKLRLGRSSREAMADFARARFLEPNNGRMCMGEVQVWLQYDPPFAIPAFREAMKRDVSRSFTFYGDLAGLLNQYPEIRPAVRSLASSPKLLYVYLLTTSGAEYESALHEFLQRFPTLEALSAAERLTFFQVWLDRGPAKELLEKLPKNPAWMRDGWVVLARRHAQTGDYRSAFEMAREQLKEPPGFTKYSGRDLEELKQAYLHNPTDSLLAMELAQKQIAAGMTSEAVQVMSELAKLPDAPMRVYFDLGVAQASKGDFRAGWDALQEYSRRMTGK